MQPSTTSKSEVLQQFQGSNPWDDAPFPCARLNLMKNTKKSWS